MKKNQSVDLLHGPIFKSLSLLAIPIMATYFIQMAYNLVDMLWIGFLGSGAVASVGVSGNFMYLANGLVNMPKIGSQALVGQSLGANNKKETKNYIEAAFQSSILFALIYGIIIIVFQKNLIQLFNLEDPTIIQDAQNFLICESNLHRYFNGCRSFKKHFYRNHNRFSFKSYFRSCFDFCL